MTSAAREVLLDCRLALELLEKETSLSLWRIHWAGAVALTRAIGHVLDKIDGRDPLVKKASSIAHSGWKKKENSDHEIFREFIEAERNNILKEYRFNLHPMESVPVAVSLQAKSAVSGRSTAFSAIFELDENVYRPVLDGYREGDDARDVLADALAWWEDELDKIDKAVAKKN